MKLRTWWILACIVLFAAKYTETSDLAEAAKQAVALVTFFSVVVATVSVLLFFLAKKPICFNGYLSAGISVFGVLSLLLLSVPIRVLLVYLSLAFFVSLIFVLADWMKGRS